MRTFSTLTIALTLAATAPVLSVGAQTPAVTAAKTEPYQAVTSRDNVELRAGPGMFYYPVTSMKNGVRLRVIGEDSGFLRVQYPEGLKACIRVEDATLNGATVKLARPAKILHANMGGGVPFCPIAFEKDPEPGTEYKLLDTLKSGDGKPSYYVVPAPAGTTGFVNKDQVRKLTPEETAAATKPPPAPAPTTPGATPGAAPGTPTPTTPIVPGTSPAAPEKAAQPGPTPTTPPATTEPVTTPPTTPGGTTTPPAEATPVTPPAPPPPPKVDPRVAEYQALEATFKRVQAQPAGEAEFEPAIAQFNAFVAKLGDSPADRRLASNMKKYAEVLQLRLEVRSALSKSDTSVTTFEQKYTQVSEQLASLERQGFFKVIGRLLPSTVYDGTRLPKLYRVVSPEPGASRTLAYLMPQPGLDLDAKLGRIVGVAGDSKMDESLKANLVTPKRVEVITLTAGGEPVNIAPAPTPLVPPAPAGGQ